MSQGRADFSEVMVFQSTEEKSAFMALTAATSLAFFAMVGFEDSVNMAEETKEPSRIFPKIMIIGLSITGVIYVLVSISSVMLVPVKELGEGNAPLLKVAQAGAPAFPVGISALITMFAVANSALINMLMASRLLYGMAHENVLPKPLGKVHAGRRTPWVAIIFTTLLAFGLIYFADLEALGGTTSLLLLCVFTVVNIAVLVLRKDTVEHQHFRTDRHTGHRRDPVCLPGDAAGGAGQRRLPDRGMALRDRRRTVGAHLARQPGPPRAAHLHQGPGQDRPRRPPVSPQGGPVRALSAVPRIVPG
jgi:amino acid transporter